MKCCSILKGSSQEVTAGITGVCFVCSCACVCAYMYVCTSCVCLMLMKTKEGVKFHHVGSGNNLVPLQE